MARWVDMGTVNKNKIQKQILYAYKMQFATIYIHDSAYLEYDKLYFSCRELCLTNIELSSVLIDDAKKEALSLFRDILKGLLEESS